MMDVTGRNCHLDRTQWQTWLEREQFPVADAYVGVLGRADFVAQCGRLLVWRAQGDAVQVSLRDYRGQADADVAMLLVLDEDAERALLTHGLETIGRLLRQGRLHAYMLMTLDALEDAGLADFVEDLGLVFPKH
jgi:hypothetical protein